MIKRLGNKGGIDPTAWIVGIAGFAATYMVWVFTSPLLRELVGFGEGLNLPQVANQQFDFIKLLFDYAMVVNAAVWLIYIIFSSIRVEVEENEFMSPY